MKEVMEHYGMALLAVIEVSGAFGIVCSCMTKGGGIYNLVSFFMQSICG